MTLQGLYKQFDTLLYFVPLKAITVDTENICETYWTEKLPFIVAGKSYSTIETLPKKILSPDPVLQLSYYRLESFQVKSNHRVTANY